MRAALVWSLLIAFAAGAAAQDRELDRAELIVEADGRARVVLVQAPGAEGTRRLQEGQPDAAGREAATVLWAAQALARWDGVEAWAPVELELAGDAGARLRATGWVGPGRGLVEREGHEVAQRFQWRVSGAQLGLVVETEDRSSLPAPSVVETLRLGRSGVVAAGALAAQLEGDGLLLRERVLRLPGEVRTIDARAGAGPSPLTTGGVVTLVDTAASRRASAEARYARMAALAGEVEAGARTLEQAAALLAEEPPLGWLGVTVEPRAEPAAVDSFTRGLEAARAAWAASPWRARVEQARTPVPLAGLEPLAPLAPAKTVAPAAPTPDTAPVLAAGEHALTCDLESWLRVELKAGQTVRVEVRSEADLDLELWADARGRRELVASSSTGGAVEAASWKAAADGPVWLRVWKGTARFALAVRVE